MNRALTLTLSTANAKRLSGAGGRGERPFSRSREKVDARSAAG
jgi:hypothetical protein